MENKQNLNEKNINYKAKSLWECHLRSWVVTNAMIYFEINFEGYHQLSVRGTKDTRLKKFYKKKYPVIAIGLILIVLAQQVDLSST